jgi:hypothetical protein
MAGIGFLTRPASSIHAFGRKSLQWHLSRHFRRNVEFEGNIFGAQYVQWPLAFKFGAFNKFG